MVQLPPFIVDAIRRPDTNKVMSTVNEDGTPHTVVCGSLTVPEPDTIAVGRVWLRTTGKNLERDPRAEFLVWSGKSAYSIVCDFKGATKEADHVLKMNEGLDKMNMFTGTLWLFEVKSVYDEGLGEGAGRQIVRSPGEKENAGGLPAV